MVMKKVLFISGGLLLLAVVLFATFHYLVEKDSSDSNENASQEIVYLCDGDAYESRFLTQELYYSENFKTLEQLVTEIELLPQFAVSPNCTYIAVQYGLNSGNPNIAKKYAALYRTAYEQAGGLKGSFSTNGFASPDEIDASVNFIETHGNYSILEWSGTYEE